MRDLAARSAEWQPPISYLPKTLLEPRRPLVALATAWGLTFVPTLALGALVSSLMPHSAFPSFPPANWYLFSLLVVVAPLLETLIMGTALVVLSRLVSPTAAVLLSALGWGVAHSTAAPAWGLVIWWPFVIFSTVFLTWRRRSTLAALGMATIAHAAHNFLPALMLVFGVET